MGFILGWILIDDIFANFSTHSNSFLGIHFFLGKNILANLIKKMRKKLHLVNISLFRQTSTIGG